MKKILLTLTLLIVAACGIFIVRHVLMPKHVKSASNETSTPDAAAPLKEWINNSIDEDCPPGDLLRYHPEWVGDAERAHGILKTPPATSPSGWMNSNDDWDSVQ